MSEQNLSLLVPRICVALENRPAWSNADAATCFGVLLGEAAQELSRYESGRAALTATIDQLRLAERLNVETVANFQKRIDELEQCHREGWRYAKEVEDEYRKRTGQGFEERSELNGAGK